jgi:hypothetical protein
VWFSHKKCLWLACNLRLASGILRGMQGKLPVGHAGGHVQWRSVTLVQAARESQELSLTLIISGPPYFTLGVRKAARPVFCTPIRSTHSRTGGYSARHRPQARKPVRLFLFFPFLPKIVRVRPHPRQKTPLPYFKPMYVCSADRLCPALEVGIYDTWY